MSPKTAEAFFFLFGDALDVLTAESGDGGNKLSQQGQMTDAHRLHLHSIISVQSPEAIPCAV